MPSWLVVASLSVPRVPDSTDRSSAVKSFTASLNLMVSVAVSPAFRAGLSLVIVAVGATVSTAIVGAADVLPALPAASAQAATVKVMLPAAVSAGGVRVAV